MTIAPKPAMHMSAARKVQECNVLAISTETKSNAANRVYQRVAVVIVDLPANASDIDVDDIGRWIEIQVPDLLQQHGPRYDLTRVAHQIFKHLEFPRQELNLLTGAA